MVGTHRHLDLSPFGLYKISAGDIIESLFGESSGVVDRRTSMMHGGFKGGWG